MPYIPNTDADRRAMLDTIGRSSLDELFSDIPQSVQDRFRPLGLESLSEMEVYGRLCELASSNAGAGMVPFAGGGVYDHYAPSVVSHLASRSEFVTAYTPYQPEISQGTLTAMFEFQTMVAELFGMDIGNASLYDGATALAEAAWMAERTRRRGRVAVSEALFPHYRRVLDTYAWGSDLELVEVPYLPNGRLDAEAVPSDLSALIVQTPNAFGVIEALDGLKDRLGDAFLVVSCNPISLGLLEPPGAFGADIVVAEGQALGLPMGFGGPLLGMFATRQEHLRQMPGRVAGRTVDADGTPGYVMAAQTREQHIRRARATSNICTNSALCALAATIYMGTLGGCGLRDVAAQCAQRAHTLAERIVEMDGFELAFGAPFFNEFVVKTTQAPQAVFERLREAGFLVSPPSELESLGLDGALRFAVTEKRTNAEFDQLVAALKGESR